jgi:hypothetical protein
VQLRRRPDVAKRALAHAEAALVDRGRRLELELASIARTDASNARGTRVPAASSTPLTCTRPFPSPVTPAR